MIHSLTLVLRRQEMSSVLPCKWFFLHVKSIRANTFALARHTSDKAGGVPQGSVFSHWSLIRTEESTQIHCWFVPGIFKHSDAWLVRFFLHLMLSEPLDELTDSTTGLTFDLFPQQLSSDSTYLSETGIAFLAPDRGQDKQWQTPESNFSSNVFVDRVQWGER